jgi:hypothetical protein
VAKPTTVSVKEELTAKLNELKVAADKDGDDDDDFGSSDDDFASDCDASENSGKDDDD